MTNTMHIHLMEEAELNDTFTSRHAQDFKATDNGVEFKAFTFVIMVSDQKDGTLVIEAFRRSREGTSIGRKVDVLPYCVFIAVHEILSESRMHIQRWSDEQERAKMIRVR